MEQVQPLVVYQIERQRPVVWQVNELARQRGVLPGMNLSSAHALCAELQARERQCDREQEVRLQVAAVLQQFSSDVQLTQGGALLLEVERSLLLFHGIESLIAALVKAVSALGYSVRWQVGWGATAALLLSALKPVHDFAPDALQGVLLRAPLRCLNRDARCPAAWLHHLHQSGLRLFSEVAAIPRAALGKRFGKPFLDYWQRVWVEKPDRHQVFHPAALFRQHIELMHEVSDTERLLFPAHRLLKDLEQYLRARQLAVQTLHWRLPQEHIEPLCFTVSLAQPGWLAQSLMELVRLRFEQVQLKAPVREIELRVDQFVALAPVKSALFYSHQEDRDSEQRLIGLLRARVGESCVQYLAAVNESWPEQASVLSPTLQESVSSLSNAERPLFLLSTPQPLVQQRGQPYCRGELSLAQGVERFSSRWWEGGDEQREYRIARNPFGERFWIFRTAHEPEQWFLHGLFGF